MYFTVPPKYSSSFELSIQVIKSLHCLLKLQKQTPQLLSRINICFMFSSLLWHRCCLYSSSFDIVRFFSINRIEQWCEVCLEAWRAVISSLHKCASCSLFTPSATCHEQTLYWRILVTLVGFSLSNQEVPVSCQWWGDSVKLWAAGMVVRLGVRTSEQVCEDRRAGLRLVQLVGRCWRYNDWVWEGWSHTKAHRDRTNRPASDGKGGSV